MDTWIWPWHKAGKWDRSALPDQKPKKYSHNYTFRHYLENNYNDEYPPTQSTYYPSSLPHSTYFSREKNITGEGTTKVVMPAQLFYLQLRTFYGFEDSKTVH